MAGAALLLTITLIHGRHPMATGSAALRGGGVFGKVGTGTAETGRALARAGPKGD